MSRLNSLSIIADQTAVDQMRSASPAVRMSEKEKLRDQCRRAAFYWGLPVCVLGPMLLAGPENIWCLLAPAAALALLGLLIRKLDSPASAAVFMLVAPVTAVLCLVAAIYFASYAPVEYPSSFSPAVVGVMKNAARAHDCSGAAYAMLGSGFIFGLLLPFRYHRISQVRVAGGS